jgi:hypothetical protein
VAAYFLGPWTWNATDACWQPPAGAVGSVDLRPLAAQGTPGPTATGQGLFALPDGSPSPGAGYLTLGSNLAGNVSVANRSAWNTRLGTTGGQFTNNQLQTYIGETLTRQADAAGATRAKPVMPDGPNLRVFLGSSTPVYSRAFQGTADAAWGPIQTVLREGYREVRRYCLLRAEFFDNQGFPLLAAYWRAKYRRFLGARLLRYRAWGLTRADLIPTDLPDEGDLPPETTLTDSFDRTDSASSLGSSSEGWSWTPVTSSTWGISSNEGYMVSASVVPIDAFANSALSDPDMYAEAALSGPGAGEGEWGLMVRRHGTSATRTFYYGGPRRLAAGYISKVVAGVLTSGFLSGSTTNSGTQTWKLDVNGTTLTLYQDGVSRATGTDSAIDGTSVGGLYAGMAHRGPSTSRWNNWTATDGLGGGGIVGSLVGGKLVGRGVLGGRLVG